MKQTSETEAADTQWMSAETGGRLTGFARACKTATRAVILYPPEHPAVAAALGNLAAAANSATAAGPLVMSVSPDTLMIDGTRLPKPDRAIVELAALLHAHQVGQITIHSQTDSELWRRFLVVLGMPPDQTRLRGGLTRLWSTEGNSQIGVRQIDFNEILRDRIRGERATWERIVRECLEGDAGALDAWTIDLVNELVENPGSVEDLVTTLHDRISASNSENGVAVLGSLLRAVAEFASQTQSGDMEAVMTAIAEATARLPAASLGPLMKTALSGSRPNLGRFMVDLVHRVKDGTIADMIATEVRSGRGTAPALADAFCGLAPDAGRRATILTLARKGAAPKGAAAEPAIAAMWKQSEDFLLTYSDEMFVSNAYDTELKNVAERAVDLEHDSTDPPDRIESWAATVAERSVRLLDAQLLIDLMRLQHDVRKWRELAELAVARIEMLAVAGDFESATFLVEEVQKQALQHEDPAVQTAATLLVDAIATVSTMRHVATHLDTVDKTTISAVTGFCLELGTAIVGPLAEVLSREERTRSRQHLIDILLGLGASGRQAVERLMQSPNAAVRRTAVLLLREFGGHDALLDLESLLKDNEPHVQRDATRAIVMMHSEPAYDTLTRALATGSSRARSVITGVLATIADDDALPVLAYLVQHAPCRGPMWDVYERAVYRLGMIGGRTAVNALTDVMYRRVVWAPFKVAVLRRLATEAMARIGSPEAVDALRAAARKGRRGARSAARRLLEAIASKSATREERS